MKTEERLQKDAASWWVGRSLHGKMRVAGVVLLALMATVVSGCLEEIEPNFESSFNKVYGLDGTTAGRDVIQLEDGGFVIVGNFTKTPDIKTDPVHGPIILQTDANGNQIRSKHYYFTQGLVSEYSSFKGIPDSVFTVDFQWVGTELWFAFTSVTQLNNGDFFVIGAAPTVISGIEGAFFFYMVLDPEFHARKIEFLNNTQIELQDSIVRGHFVRDPQPILDENGDVLLLRGGLFKNGPRYEGYTLYRFNEGGDIVSVTDFPHALFSGFVFPDSWVLDGLGNVVLCGTFAEPSFPEEDFLRDNDIWVHRINLGTMQRDKEYVFGQGHYNYTWRGGIQTTDDGFVLGDYHADAIGEVNQGTEDDGFRNIYGGLWFLDTNLDSIGKAHLTDLEVEQQIGRIVKTSDNGLVAAYWRKNPELNDVLVVKSDIEGKVIWRRVLNSGFDGVEGNTNLPISKIIPTSDGGVAILGNMDFNEMGNRMNLVKISADGKL